MKTTTEMQLVPITKLVPYVNNARTHSPEQIKVLHKRQALGGHPYWKRLNLRSPHGSDTGKQPAQRKTPGAVKQASEGQSLIRHGALPRYTCIPCRHAKR